MQLGEWIPPPNEGVREGIPSKSAYSTANTKTIADRHGLVAYTHCWQSFGRGNFNVNEIERSWTLKI